MVIAITTADSNYLETELIQKEILDPMKEERNFAEKMWNVIKKNEDVDMIACVSHSGTDRKSVV